MINFILLPNWILWSIFLIWRNITEDNLWILSSNCLQHSFPCYFLLIYVLFKLFENIGHWSFVPLVTFYRDVCTYKEEQNKSLWCYPLDKAKVDVLAVVLVGVKNLGLLWWQLVHGEWGCMWIWVSVMRWRNEELVMSAKSWLQ